MLKSFTDENYKKTVEIVKNAIRKGLDNQFISELTGLTVEQIELLRKDTNKN